MTHASTSAVIAAALLMGLSSGVQADQPAAPSPAAPSSVAPSPGIPSPGIPSPGAPSPASASATPTAPGSTGASSTPSSPPAQATPAQATPAEAAPAPTTPASSGATGTPGVTAPASTAPATDVQPAPAEAPKPKLSSAPAATLTPVVGRYVRDLEGQQVGRVWDILIDSKGQPHAAIIDYGGVLGVGKRKVAIDWSALRFSMTNPDGDVTVALTSKQMGDIPEYKYDAGDITVGKPDHAP